MLYFVEAECQAFNEVLKRKKWEVNWQEEYNKVYGVWPKKDDQLKEEAVYHERQASGF